MDQIPSPPDSSPSSNTSDSTLQPSRKRQRSLSMQSDSAASSASAKRSVVETSANDTAARNPRADQLSGTDPNQDIDAYMAEQGEDEMPTFLPTAMIQPTTSDEAISPMDRYKKVRKLKDRKMVVGEEWYLVAKSWWKNWARECIGLVSKDDPATATPVGPVDNLPLLDESGKLRRDLADGVEVLPLEAFNLLVEWYGKPAHVIARPVIARGIARETSVEFHPLTLLVYRLVKTTSGGGDWPATITISAGATLSILSEKLSAAVTPADQPTTPFRIWMVSDLSAVEGLGLEFPVDQLTAAGANVIDSSNRTLGEQAIQSDDAFIVEFKQAEGWLAPTRIEQPIPIFNSGEGFFNKMNAQISPSTTLQPSLYGSFSTPSKPSTAVTLQSKPVLKTIEPGTLGLGNMGNTCFMNSALQCLAHTKELTDYFLSGVYGDELNRDNPLGMGGAIAEAFGALLQRIWASTSPSTSYSPREFKMQLQRFAPQFSGYQQHDSQELVAFLLDGLHEDLNRVHKKPYVEKPDWEGGGDLELAKLAQVSWEGYMKRNDSVIVDLFQGQYRSTLVCPECQKVSITFDPFMYLTLPLPIQKKWKHTIYYVPWDLQHRHRKIPVELNGNSTFKELNALLARWVGAPPENLMAMEIFNNRFYKVLDDNVTVGEMGGTDTIVVFELPCNARQSRSYKKKPDDPFLVPVYLSDARPLGRALYTTSRNSPGLFGYPMIIAITREESQSLDAMYDLIVSRLERWTAHARDLYSWEEGPETEHVPLDAPAPDSITEITEDGKVITVESSPPEGDIVDEKAMILDGVDEEDPQLVPHKVGTKKDLFNIRLQAGQKEYGTATGFYTRADYSTWDTRIQEAEEEPCLLREDDALYLEFEEDRRGFFFGDSGKWDYALWDVGSWEVFTHPEYEEAKKANADKQGKGISLHDCLDEFTKEEKLGEDDLWYCPSCKKHQQATKKFDLWKAPDILAVHLKRFSNNRTLRDKIDAHIDFPTEGLDLTDRVQERIIAKKLLAEGVDIAELDLTDAEEPLIYDLFAVDEHIGGLGGGHYRAYAYNHTTEKWYHFDDSFVTSARASDSVNSNAYLLFYRRRSASPLGGKSFRKIQEAKAQPKVEVDTDTSMAAETQQPTPPNEPTSLFSSSSAPLYSGLSDDLGLHDDDRWKLRSQGSNVGSPAFPSPPADDPPDFADIDSDPLISYGPSTFNSRFDYPDQSNKASPTSSNEVELDTDPDREDDTWRTSFTPDQNSDDNGTHLSPPYL